MGAQVSTNKQVIQTDIVTEAYNSCPNIAVSNTVNMQGVNFRPDLNPNCTGDTSFDISQTAGVDATCVITSMQDSLAKTLSTMDAEALGGLGFSGTSNILDIKNELSQKVENDCGNQSVTNVADIKDTTVTSCNMRVVQNASAKSSCTINSLQKIANDLEANSKSKAQGSTLASLLFGYGGIASIAMIIVVILIAVLIYYSFSGGKNEEKDTEENSEINDELSDTTDNTDIDTDDVDSKSSPKDKDDDSLKGGNSGRRVSKGMRYSLIALLVVLVIAAFIYPAMRRNGNNIKTINPENIGKFYQTYNEANQMMKNMDRYNMKSPITCNPGRGPRGLSEYTNDPYRNINYYNNLNDYYKVSPYY